jgi:hypothetical protein
VSIRIFLADGVPDGLWIVEKSNWTGVGLMCPRAVYSRLREREELGRTGVYVLVGPSDSGVDRGRVYVGEGDGLRNRLDQHHKGKDFWTHAVVFVSKDESLNKAHVKYLESRLLGLAQEAQRVELDNGNAPQLPTLSEAETADTEAFLDEMLLIYPVLDVRAFEKITVTGDTASRLHLKGAGGAIAEGKETPEGFVVFEGAIARLASTPSMHTYMSNLREKLVADGVLIPVVEGLRFTRDYLFGSPSTAAAVVLGRNANGRMEWKDAGGRTLKEIQAATVQELAGP